MSTCEVLHVCNITYIVSTEAVLQVQLLWHLDEAVLRFIDTQLENEPNSVIAAKNRNNF
jgi:hypothetical protein